MNVKMSWACRCWCCEQPGNAWAVESPARGTYGVGDDLHEGPHEEQGEEEPGARDDAGEARARARLDARERLDVARDGV